MADTDEEQIEAIKKWWKENGAFVVVGLVIGAAAVFGWRAWENHQQEQAVAASGMYAKMQEAIAADDTEQVRALGNTLVSDYSATPYAVQAALLLARQNISADELSTAQEHLQWAVDNAPNESLALTARLRLAQVLHARGDNEAALRTLGLAQAGAFAGLYAQARGDIYVAMGQTDKARDAYNTALAELGSGSSGDRAMLEMKLATLTTPAANTESE